MRILVAEDETVFGSYLAATLSAQNWEVRVASAGDQAIDLGVTFRPQVLIADWLLRNRYDGLEVSNALRTIDPQLQTVLITSYCSADLRTEATVGGVFRIIEKPAPLHMIVDAVTDAVASLPMREPPVPVPVAIVDADGKILHANSYAQTLFQGSTSGAEVQELTDLFDEAVIDRLGASTQAWVGVTPIAQDQMRWRVRSRRVDGTWLLVILQSAAMDMRDDILLRLLLDVPAAPSSRWPFDESVIMVSRSQVHRRALSGAIEERGSRCYRAETPALAKKLLEADPEVGIVVLDCAWPGLDVAAFVRELTILSSTVTIIGTGVQSCDFTLKEAGVACFLSHPWSLDQLVDAISSTRNTCGEQR